MQVWLVSPFLVFGVLVVSAYGIGFSMLKVGRWPADLLTGMKQPRNH